MPQTHPCICKWPAARSMRQMLQIALHRHSTSFSTRTPALPHCTGTVGTTAEWEQGLEAVLICLVVPKISRTHHSLLCAGPTDAVEILCTFGKLAYFRILFRNQSLELLFLAHFLLCGSPRMIKFPTSSHREQISSKFVLVKKLME